MKQTRLIIARVPGTPKTPKNSRMFLLPAIGLLTVRPGGRDKRTGINPMAKAFQSIGL